MLYEYATTGLFLTIFFYITGAGRTDNKESSSKAVRARNAVNDCGSKRSRDSC